MSEPKKDPEDFDEEELIRSEFDSIVSGLSLDESAPTTYLDDLDRIDEEKFVQPNPHDKHLSVLLPQQSVQSIVG